MSFFLIVMATGWTTAIAGFGFCALKESGKLAAGRKRMADWLNVLPEKASVDVFAESEAGAGIN